MRSRSLPEPDWVRWLRAAATISFLAVSASGALGASRMLLHATLLRSTPAADSRLHEPPETIRLVFSERVVPELSQITLVRPDSVSAQLKVTSDPHDARTLVGQVAGSEFREGKYKVTWRVVSADGHAIGGSFVFSLEPRGGVSGPRAVSIVGKPSRDSAALRPYDVPSHMPGSDERSVPVLASLLRGVGLGALMMGIGSLFFGSTAGEHRSLMPGTLVISLTGVGALLLVIHGIAWLHHLSPTGHLSRDYMVSMLGSTLGRVELLRIVLALLTFLAIAIARRPALALAFGTVCLLVSGAVGHPAAIHPFVAIPAKMIHLVSASIWLGGLVWLVWLAHCDHAACRIEATRVSSIALISIIAIFLSGLLQAVLFLSTPGDLIHSNYGLLVLAKLIGLAILVGFGAYNRFGLLPRLDASDGARKLARSVKQEIAIVTTVILIGGFLAYVPTPPVPQTALPEPEGIER